MKRTLIAAALLSSSLLTAAATAQSAPSLARFIPSDALLTLEISDLSGAEARLGQTGKDLSSLDLFALAGVEWPAEARKVGFSGPLDFISREGIISLHLNAKTLEPQILAVSRPKAGLDKPFAQFFADSLKPKAGKKAVVLAEGAYRFVQEGTGSSASYFGYQNGVAYLSNNPQLLRNFLKGVAGKGSSSLLSSPAYSSAMNTVGAGTLRAYLNFSAGGEAARSLAALGGSQEGAALASSLKTLGQFAGSIALRPDGVVSSGVLIPNANGGDAQLYALLTPKGQSFNLVSSVPATVTSFGAGQLNLRGFTRYVDSWITRLGGKGTPTLNQLAKQSLSIDLEKDLLAWVGDEYATASFNTGSAAKASTLNPNDPLAALSGIAFYVAVTDEAAARAGLTKLIDAGFGLSGSLGMTTSTGKASSTPKKSTKTIAGSSVTVYSSQGSGVYYTVKDKALIVTLTEADMTRALSSGARLSDSAQYKAVAAKFPALTNTLSYSAVPQPQTRQNIRSQIETALTGASSDLSVTQKNKLVTGLTNFVDNFQRRLGAGNGYSSFENGKLITKSFQAVKWN